MAKNAKGRRRRKNSKHYDSDDDDESLDRDNTGTRCKTAENKNSHGNKNNKSDLSFAEKRDLQRKAAAEKRRQKMKCYLCGKTGHVRRECPGIADDGRGESKYTKSNGDAGAVHLKHKGRKKHGNHSNSGSSGSKTIALPPGFEKEPQKSQAQPFWYYDAGFGEGRAILEYLRFGRHGHGGNHKSSHNNSNSNTHNHTQVSKKDAILEYDAAMKGVCETTNFGGCIVRSYLPTTTITTSEEEPWRPQDSFPFSWFRETPSLLKFVVGYPLDSDKDGGDENDNADRGGISQEMVHRLVEIANSHKGEIIGFFADLDYTVRNQEQEPRQTISRAVQLQRLRSTLKAASMVDCPVQIRIAPGYKVCQQSAPTLVCMNGEANNNSNGNVAQSMDGYSLAIRDLGEIFLEASVYPWKVHLSSWNGKAEHLVALSGAFSSSSSSNPEHPTKHQLVFGFDGSLGFSKAVHLHESAFEVDPSQVVLETGGPGILPPVVAKYGGRNAFCHSGQIPFVAEELAKHLSKNPRNNTNHNLADDDDDDKERHGEITAEIVARWASTTTMELYGLQ